MHPSVISGQFICGDLTKTLHPTPQKVKGKKLRVNAQISASKPYGGA